MDRRTVTVLTWITAACAIASALWLALGGAGAKRYGLVPLVLGRPVPPALDGAGPKPLGPAAPRRSDATGDGR